MTTRVLHLLGPLRPSGMERMLVTGAEHFRREDIFSIVVGQGSDHPFEAELRAAGHDVRILPPVASSLAGAMSFRRMVREQNVDVIHIHTEGNYLRTALTARFSLGRKGILVRTVHNVFEASGLWLASRFLQALFADRLVSALIAPSPEVAANEKKIFRNVNVIYNWVDDVFFGISERRQSFSDRGDAVPVAVIVGNCSEIKHHERALRGLISTNHELIHIGSESDASPEELALLDSLEGSGRLIGRGTGSPNSALLLADYFAMPSRHEGMGVALAEALVAGVRSLVNDVPGLRWARDMDGVSMLPDHDADWARAISNWRDAEKPPNSPSIDFSAARGAKEYAQVYRLAKERRSLVPKRFAEGATSAGMA